MELKISDDENLIFITQGLDDPYTEFDIKVWRRKKDYDNFNILELQKMGVNFKKII